jgi:uncharacterized protein YejL (UPF0352 family)
MSDNKVITMPGVSDTETPVFSDKHFEAEERLVAELAEILERFNGKVSNLALIGALNLYANLVALGSLEEDS